MRRFEGVLDLLPKGYVFDGELVVLLLMADGIDLRPLPLRERKATLARVGKGADR